MLAQVTALHAMIINQLTAAGLRCVMMPESTLMAQKGVVLIGLKATSQQLLKEQQNRSTENSLRILSLGHSKDVHKSNMHHPRKVPGSPSRFTVAPAEEILLTKRIINRALEVLRVHQGDSEKYLKNGTTFAQCLSRSCECCLGCYPPQKYDDVKSVPPCNFDVADIHIATATRASTDGREGDKLIEKPLQIGGEPGQDDHIIQQVFALHDRRVNHNLWHMFWRDLACGLCCKVEKFDHYPMLNFCDEVNFCSCCAIRLIAPAPVLRG